MQEHFVWQYSLIFGLIRLFDHFGSELWRETLSSHMQLLSSSPFMDTNLSSSTWASAAVKTWIKPWTETKCVCWICTIISEKKMSACIISIQRLQIVAAMDTDAHRVSAHHWLQHRTKDREVDKNSQTNLRTVSVEPSQSDPGLWDARRFVKTDVRHLNVTAAAAATRPDTGAPATSGHGLSQ